MSRIGKQPVQTPKNVQVQVEGSTVTMKGPKGELKRTFDPLMKITLKDGVIVVERTGSDNKARALHGLTRTLINNMVIGVSQGYHKSLDIVGVGYRASQQGKNITLQLGFSHPVEVKAPPGIELQVEGQNRLHVRGPEKELVGLVAAKIRRLRPPDRYKGKGVRYSGEEVHLKPGKAGKAVAGKTA